MIRPRIRTLAMLACLGLGLWQFGQGSYIYAKALLAQRLIADAWQETLTTLKQTKPWPWADTWPVSRLQVPELGIDLYVLAGDNGSSLAFGPGHRFGSALPGKIGTCLISGHRDTHFAFLRRLKPGAEILLQDMHGHWHHYQVNDTQVVDQASPVWQDLQHAVLTLVTCYPFDAIVPGGPLRYVVNAKKLDSINSCRPGPRTFHDPSSQCRPAPLRHI
jgi:sortase A